MRTESLVSIARVDTRGALANALDVSIGGIRFRAVGVDLELGEALEVQLTLGQQTVSVIGRLTRVTDLDGFTQEVALQFTSVRPETLQLLQQHLPEGYELDSRKT